MSPSDRQRPLDPDIFARPQVPAEEGVGGTHRPRPIGPQGAVPCEPRPHDHRRRHSDNGRRRCPGGLARVSHHVRAPRRCSNTPGAPTCCGGNWRPSASTPVRPLPATQRPPAMQPSPATRTRRGPRATDHRDSGRRPNRPRWRPARPIWRGWCGATASWVIASSLRWPLTRRRPAA
jgi:hypothetical protein